MNRQFPRLWGNYAMKRGTMLKVANQKMHVQKLKENRENKTLIIIKRNLNLVRKVTQLLQ